MRAAPEPAEWGVKIRSSSTIFGFINYAALNNMEIITPLKNVLDKFEENDRLEKIRDILLTKFMNSDIVCYINK